jgi:superfamily II DNA or RNA helicase
MRELIERHYLCDYEIVCPTSDLEVKEEEKSASGDWSNQTLRKAAKKSHIVGDVVENYIRFANGRKAIVFATDVETSGEIAKKFNENGISAASLSAETPTATRDHFIKQFKSGKLFVLVNVDLFDEGFSVDGCDVVIMARPTASLGKFRQQAGRALRYQIGKVALIIDMVSNVIRHGLPDKHIDWTLARRDKRAKQLRDPNEIPLTTCGRCTKPYERFRVVCPYCGYEKPLPEPRSRSIEMVEGDLVLLDRATLERMRQGTVLETPASIAQRVAVAAGQYAGMAAAKRQGEKMEAHEHLRETIAQWAAIERERGFSDREIQRKFYYVTGMDVITALDATRPKSEMDSLNSTIQQWWRA